MNPVQKTNLDDSADGGSSLEQGSCLIECKSVATRPGHSAVACQTTLGS
jgi:hypothetical protein